ncbi:hypothetical protein GUJ93_ZPchr0007g5596 [Zizania palustris]|uniref:Uncharacterized protein n=1 Tax=Zizania palustris TaxID=103762 RepID=A0A8J5VZ32_ZIZPA|nr:hypothetical protein GUJ93_ZPchr0007g5596 [Zizania palustris]
MVTRKHTSHHTTSQSQLAVVVVVAAYSPFVPYAATDPAQGVWASTCVPTPPKLLVVEQFFFAHPAKPRRGKGEQQQKLQPSYNATDDDDDTTTSSEPIELSSAQLMQVATFVQSTECVYPYAFARSLELWSSGHGGGVSNG